MAAAMTRSTAGETLPSSAASRDPKPPPTPNPRTGSAGRRVRAGTKIARSWSSAAGVAVPSARAPRTDARRSLDGGTVGRSPGRPPSVRALVDEADDLARDVGDVLDEASVGHLPITGFTPQLPHRLDLVVPALHVALRQVPARGIDGQPAAGANRSAAEIAVDVVVGAEAEAGQGQWHVRAEAVVDLQRVDVLRTT